TPSMSSTTARPLAAVVEGASAVKTSAGTNAPAARLPKNPARLAGQAAWIARRYALRKPPSTGIQIVRAPRPGYSNDPHHGTPCACADGGLCRGVDAGHVPRRKQQSVAGQGTNEATARAALAAPAKEEAETFTDPCARFQGRGGARSLETGHHRPFPDPQDLSDLSVVGRSWAEVAGGRPSDSRGVLYSYARVDESQLQLLSCDQCRLPPHLRQSEQPRRQLAHDPRRLLVERLLCHDRRTDKRDLFAGARLIPRRPAVIPGPGLSVPLDAGESGAASK